MTQESVQNSSLGNAHIHVPWTGYVALAFAVVFFSGVFMNAEGWLQVLDYSNISGQFGKLGTLTEGGGRLASNFRGMGGSGPKDAFVYGLTIAPQIMFALGIVKIIENYGGLLAAQKLLTPLMRLLFGQPGFCALPLIAGMQNSDTGASMIKQMRDEKLITEREKLVFIAFHFTAPALIVNYFAIGAMAFPYLKISIIVPLVVVMVTKFIGANVFRFFIVNRLIKES